MKHSIVATIARTTVFSYGNENYLKYGTNGLLIKLVHAMITSSFKNGH